MAYIGKTPTIGNFQVCDAISVVNNQAAYTMQVGGVNVSPESANHMIVSLNGVIQKPTDAYTVSNSVITFASNLVTGDSIDFIQILGNVLDLGVPSDNTVTEAKLSNSSVTTAKLNDASVSLAKLSATGTKDATTFLRGDNSFAAPPAGGIENITTFRLSTGFTMGTGADITTNWGTGGASLGTAISESSGVFSFPQTGFYLIQANFYLQRIQGDSDYIGMDILGTTNNSSYSNLFQSYTAIADTANVHNYLYGTTIFDVTDISNYKVKLAYQSESATNIGLVGNTSMDRTYIRFIRLGDT
ncbi:hypothetical protein PQZ72_02410 [Candidatus Pelagibacter sp.]|nr:hypothetical protein [Candidatus Pelagibacter sp.]